ncbi:TonB-dependent receptor [Arenicella sp. 4NH20-0111]|uniref:TonB-dependent receptor n=1 Tax=Arenicella sp. 4NH20-0111 TaxID=3127648 RepID=UPI00310B6CCA
MRDLKRFNPKAKITTLVVAGILSSASSFTYAQEESQSATSLLLEEVVVTARKREESIMDVPIAVSAFNSDQLEILKVRDIQSLSVGLPNVAFDDIGTTRGVANFSIRGLGINSSIPSIDPTVGTFIDGVYLGTNAGVVFDVFDLDSIEVLRGPQGTLFGRNVTGGAVLLNSKAPGEEFEGKIKASIEGGGEDTNQYLMGSFGGPISDTLAAKISFYSNQDDGYFLNQFSGEAFGKQDTVSVRPMIVWTPSDSVSVTAIYDYFDSEGDGPASQNHVSGSETSNGVANFDRDSLDFSIDNDGFLTTKSDFFRTTTEIEVGNGTITNVFGYRDLEQTGSLDVDATPLDLFNSLTALDAEQISNELRYSGEISDKLQLTTGVYYFKNELKYNENRRLLGLVAPPGIFGLTQDGGGEYDVKTLGVFATLDYSMSDRTTLNFGLRYTDEEKSANIASLIRNLNAPCSVVAGNCPFDFQDEESWSNLSPKIGFTHDMGDTSLVYGHWTRGFRSGGYNLRNTAIDTVNFGPGPFDEETVENLELGYKTTFANGGRLTAAVFYNQIDDMQREINLADPISGVVQVIRNTADATITGIEVDVLMPLSDNLLLNASMGYIDPEYDSVRFDLNGDGAVNGADLNLDLPRAANLTYAVGLTLDTAIGAWGTATSRLSYAFRDESAYTDNNLGFINEQGILDFGIDFRSENGRWDFGLYGKNLTDEVKHGGDTQLPSLLGPIPLGGTFSPLAKGRIYGAEVTFNF